MLMSTSALTPGHGLCILQSQAICVHCWGHSCSTHSSHFLPQIQQVWTPLPPPRTKVAQLRFSEQKWRGWGAGNTLGFFPADLVRPSWLPLQLPGLEREGVPGSQVP